MCLKLKPWAYFDHIKQISAPNFFLLTIMNGTDDVNSIAIAL